MRIAPAVAAVTLALVLVSPTAYADCTYGDLQRPGSIGPYQTDDSRSFTVNGAALLTVANAHDDLGNAADLEVTFPDQCKTRVGPTISCTVHGDGEFNAIIKNPGGQQVIYVWLCTSPH